MLYWILSEYYPYTRGAVTQVAKLVVLSVNALIWHCWVSGFLVCAKVMNTIKHNYLDNLGIKTLLLSNELVDSEKTSPTKNGGLFDIFGMWLPKKTSISFLLFFTK